MFFLFSKFRFVALTITLLLIIGCAAIEGVKAPEPIATSLEQMPNDASMMARAIQERMTMTGQEQVQNVRFTGETGATLSQTWSFMKGFVHTDAQLYEYQAAADTPSAKTASGRLDFEGPLGRRASALYHTSYRLSGINLVVEEARVEPIYSNFPEPMMFVIHAEELPKETGAYPGTYTGLLHFASEHAVNPSKPESISLEKEEYVIFVFLLDRISPSSKLEIKVSDEKNGIRGYTKSTKYIDFNGWRVALLYGRFIMFDNRGTQPLYVKAVFIPGREVAALSRSPKLVGLFYLDGTRPKP